MQPRRACVPGLTKAHQASDVVEDAIDCALADAVVVVDTIAAGVAAAKVGIAETVALEDVEGVAVVEMACDYSLVGPEKVVVASGVAEERLRHAVPSQAATLATD